MHSIHETIDALADVRRADGALPNEKITVDGLSPTVLALLRGDGPTGPTAPTGPEDGLDRRRFPWPVAGADPAAAVDRVRHFVGRHPGRRAAFQHGVEP
ncbi:hypothetical protein [Mesorhizobium sp. M0771]|uniref:hypothetical protein n=1 Tax=Mesorhizobium sp. M0771 TaxID=2956997 RepID=UPI003339DC9B